MDANTDHFSNKDGTKEDVYPNTQYSEPLTNQMMRFLCQCNIQKREIFDVLILGVRCGPSLTQFLADSITLVLIKPCLLLCLYLLQALGKKSQRND